MLYVVPSYSAVFEVEYNRHDYWWVIKIYDFEFPEGAVMTEHENRQDAINLLDKCYFGWIVD